MKLLMTPVDRLPSNRSRKDYEGQAKDILAKLPDEVPTLVASGSYNELSSIALHLRKVLPKECVVVRSIAKDSEVYELYATKVSF